MDGFENSIYYYETDEIIVKNGLDLVFSDGLILHKANLYNLF